MDCVQFLMIMVMEMLRTMAIDGVAQRVKKIIAEKLGHNVFNITFTQNCSDDLGADSLDVVEIVTAIEEEFGIDFPEDVDKLETVGDIVEYITPLHI